MNWEHIKADWLDVKGQVRSKWGKLTDDDVELVAGKWDQLVSRLRARYGYAKDRAEQEVDAFLKDVGGRAKNQDNRPTQPHPTHHR